MKNFLKELRARREKRLAELRSAIENDQVTEEELEGVEAEIDAISDEITDIDEKLADQPDEDPEVDPESEPNPVEPEPEAEPEAEPAVDPENRAGMISKEKREGLLGKIKSGVEARNVKSAEQRRKEIRSTFARYVVGQASESEARALGIVNGNGGVTVPKEIVPEVISYAQELNPLRTDGSVHRTKSTQGFPILVKKAEVTGHKEERGTDKPIPDSAIEFDEIELDPTEFDALALVTKKLLNRSDLPIEDIVLEELGKAYAVKEGVYFFRGDEVGNINKGAMAKKAVAITATADGTDGPKMFDQLVDMKNSAKASVRRKSKWYLNDAAIAIVEKMKDNEGRPLYKALDQLRDGIDGRLLNYDVTVTEFADKSADDTETAVFYFGDPKSFHIQDVIGSLEVQRLVEKYADTNHIGLKIYNLLDGQLIYSPLEPTMYRMEIAKPAVAPNP